MAYVKRNYNRKPVAPIVRVARDTSRVWSEYQKAIFSAIENDTDNLVISAVPGSGKTTSIVESLYHVPAGKEVVFLAFNKSIATELQSRVPEGVDCKTTHAIGLKIITSAFGKIEVDNRKGERIAISLVGDEPENAQERNSLMKVMDLCKGYLAEKEEDIDTVIDKHGIDVGDGQQRKTFIANVIKGLGVAASQNRLIDFSDMIWFVSKHNLRMPKLYDYVFCDEVQDLNKAQIELVLRLIKPNGRIVAVGDSRQAIYGFRGADSEAMQNITTRTNARTLPLSVSYRCARRVVEECQKIESSIEASPTAPEGIVETVSQERMLKDAQPGDFVISRVNAPLIGLCTAFLKAGKKANIQGRDVGKGLLFFIKKSKATDVDSFLTYVEEWKNIEVERLTKKNRECEWVLDKAEMLTSFCEGAHTLDEVKENIEKMFDDTDDNNRIILGSTHRMKGLERSRCWVLNKTYKPGRNTEEANLYYVAMSRSKHTLMLVA
jgi:DNA helicase II / ATP-dependent DNA helicase PcrA